jgi:predicted transposase YbfD/YdcC
VEDKSNEITAIPELLKMLDVKKAIITIDAMGCQGNRTTRRCLRRNYRLWDLPRQAFMQRILVEFSAFTEE